MTGDAASYHPVLHRPVSPLSHVRRDRQSSAPMYAPHIRLEPVKDDRPCMTRQLSMTADQQRSRNGRPLTSTMLEEIERTRIVFTYRAASPV